MKLASHLSRGEKTFSANLTIGVKQVGMNCGKLYPPAIQYKNLECSSTFTNSNLCPDKEESLTQNMFVAVAEFASIIGLMSPVLLNPIFFVSQFSGWR